MAGDWIKMRCLLRQDPAVVNIGKALSMPDYSIVGGLHAMWSWADMETEDGNASVTPEYLDCYAGIEGLAKEMVTQGWLELTDDGVRFPNFERHNGKCAKKRALTRGRVETHRKRKRNAASVTGALPEKRREEKRNNKIPPKAPVPGGEVAKHGSSQEGQEIADPAANAASTPPIAQHPPASKSCRRCGCSEAEQRSGCVCAECHGTSDPKPQREPKAGGKWRGKGGKRTGKATARARALPPWFREFDGVHEAYCESPLNPAAAETLAPAVERLGAEAALVRWKFHLETQELKFAGAKNFASRLAAWKPPAGWVPTGKNRAGEPMPSQKTKAAIEKEGWLEDMRRRFVEEAKAKAAAEAKAAAKALETKEK